MASSGGAISPNRWSIIVSIKSIKHIEHFPYLGNNLATFNLALLMLQKLKVAMVFALESKLSKTLKRLLYFVLRL